MTATNRFLFAGGGTGGHLTPGLAVAAELPAVFDKCEIVFVGSDRPIERQMLASTGYEHLALPVESTAHLSRHPLRFASGLWRSYRAARSIVKSRAPRAVIGLGGFASVPLVWAAARAGIPTILLEQNTIPGRANRFLSRLADAVCLSFDAARARFPRGNELVLTGNPVRSEIAALAQQPPDEAAPPRATLLILGGSQGAAGLNDAVRTMFEIAGERRRDWRIVHQAGASACDALRAAYDGLALDARVEPFLTDMATQYRQATLAITRGGATTLAELACAGLPAIVVPYPQAADDHQRDNAEQFQSAAATRVVLQQADPTDTARRLLPAVDELLGNPAALGSMRRAMRQLARPDAARRVVQVLQTLTAAPMR